MAVHITDGVEVASNLHGSFGDGHVEIQGLAKMSVADAVVLNSNDAAISFSNSECEQSVDQDVKQCTVGSILEWHVGCCVTGRQVSVGVNNAY